LILYTHLPLEQVLAGLDELEAPQDIAFENVMLQVQPLPGGKGRVVRLISPRPEDYLNPRYAPGAVIALPDGPEEKNF